MIPPRYFFRKVFKRGELGPDLDFPDLDFGEVHCF